MALPTRDEIVAIYKREAKREVEEVAKGRMKESTHGTVLACVRSHVHLLLRSTPEAMKTQERERPETPGVVMQAAWKQTDELIVAADCWDGPPGAKKVAP